MIDVTTQQKTLLITVSHSFISKNILNTEVMPLLTQSFDRIVLVVPHVKKEFFEKHYASPAVSVEGVDISDFLNSRLETFMHRLSRLVVDTHYLHYKRREVLDVNRTLTSWVKFILQEAFVKFFADLFVVKKIYLFLDGKLSQKRLFTHLFKKYNPNLIFATDIFDQTDIQIVREAQSADVKVVGMVRSWDNCLSKGMLRIYPDKIITNNVVLKEELSTTHLFPHDRITPVGLPQFDAFLKTPPEDRHSFLSKIGLDPHKRIVMFAPAGTILSETDGDICDLLLKAKKDHRLPSNIQFFVRNHPHHPADLSSVKDHPDMHIQSPGQILDPTTHKASELTSNDLYFLRNILAHTDVLLWVATSLCLDALVYDIPQVVVNFDGYTSPDYYHSVKRYHNEGHMKKLFALKPFKVANNKEDLIRYINTYLEKPAEDKEERENVRAQQLFLLDGHASARLVRVITDALSSREGDDA